MTRRATFGDFAAYVRHHLRRLQWAAVPSASGERADAAAELADLSRAVHALACYAQDVSGALDAEYLAGDRQLGVWVRAATRVRQALATAEAALPAAGPEDAVSANRPRRGSGDLRAATRSMTLGRDLLHTHETIQASRVTAGGSEWTPGRHLGPGCLRHPARGRQLGTSDSRPRLSAFGHGQLPGCGTPDPQRGRQDPVSSFLGRRRGAGTASCPQGPAQAAARHPVERGPDPCLPTSGDSVANLNAGVISTAERLRVAAQRASAEVPWSRQLTRETLRQTAGCCAISASNMQVMLTTLATDHGKLCAPFSATIARAAQAADRARAAWLTVTESWESITTDTRGAMGSTGV